MHRTLVVRMEIMKDKINQKISRFQCGGIEGRSTVDHLLTLNAVIDYNTMLGAPTYIWFGDAYKCFDKLDLKDCIKEIGKMIGWKDALLISKMNENGKAIIRCPAGETDTIEITENVRQGTIYGPKLCSIVTDRVNEISRKNITLIRNIEIESLIFVDDIMFPASRKEGIEMAIGNCRSLEQLKKFTFNTNPSKSAVLVIDKKAKKADIQVRTEVKCGKISSVNEYKYLGEWYSLNGSKEVSIKTRNKKVEYLLKEIRKYGDVNKVGKMALEVRKKVYETVVVPTLFANTETWSNVTENELNELEKMQYKILREIYEQPQSTPYWGIIAESGIWPVAHRIEYKKIMLFHSIINSEEKRLIKEIIEDQLRSPYGLCWTKSIVNICNKYNIKSNGMRGYTKKALTLSGRNNSHCARYNRG